MPLSMTPGSSIIVMVQFSDADMAFAEIRAARHSQNSRNPLHAGLVFRGFPIHLRYSPPGCSPPFDGSDQVSPAPEGFYFQASGSLVTLTAAGYNYNIDWTPLLAGLAPARMAASLAAPDRSVQISRTTLFGRWFTVPLSAIRSSPVAMRARARVLRARFIGE